MTTSSLNIRGNIDLRTIWQDYFAYSAKFLDNPVHL